MLLLDEPPSALDAKVRVQLRDEIRRIQQRLGMTTIFVTHDQEEALAVSDRIAVMNAGGIEQQGTPRTSTRDRRRRSSRSSSGAARSCRRSWRAAEPPCSARRCRCSRRADGPARVFVRPENLVLGADGAPGIVVGTSYLGAVRRTQVRAEDGTELVVQHAASEPVEPGALVRLRVRPEPVAATDPED